MNSKFTATPVNPDVPSPTPSVQDTSVESSETVQETQETVEGVQESSETTQETQESLQDTENTEVDAGDSTQTEDQSDVFAARFAALSKKEKALRSQEEQVKEYQEKIAQLEQIKEGGVAKALEYHGFTIDDVIDYALGSAEAEKAKDPVMSLKEEFEAYKKQVEAEKEAKLREKEEINQKAYDEAIQSHKQKIADVISSNPDTYELITSQNQQELVWEVTQAHFEQTGEVLSVEDAASQVETYLEGQVRELLKLKKFSSTGSTETQSGIEDKMQSKAQSSVAKENSQTRVLTREERLAKAAQNLKWN